MSQELLKEETGLSPLRFTLSLRKLIYIQAERLKNLPLKVYAVKRSIFYLKGEIEVGPLTK